MKGLPRLTFDNLKRGAREDRSLVGITFVDVLFALVIGKILDVAVEWPTLHAPAFFHLAVAFTLTVTSWVGYHNSWNRPRYFIRFVNLPLSQFTVDIALVVVYWFTASYVDGATGSLSPRATGVPETNLVAASFFLYVVWDAVAHAIRMSEKYPRFLAEFDAPERRKVTRLFFSLSLLGVVYWVLLNPAESPTEIAVNDLTLILMLVGFRVMKELAEAPRETEPEPVEDLRRAADYLTRATIAVSGQPESQSDA